MKVYCSGRVLTMLVKSVEVVGVTGGGLKDKEMEELSCGYEERQTNYKHGGKEGAG